MLVPVPLQQVRENLILETLEDMLNHHHNCFYILFYSIITETYNANTEARYCYLVALIGANNSIAGNFRPLCFECKGQAHHDGSESCMIGRAGASPPSLTTWTRCITQYSSTVYIGMALVWPAL